jgi:hypothetical protein
MGNQGSVILHPKKGVNPRMTCCIKCGKDVGIVLLGIKDYYYDCKTCNIRSIGSKKCMKCNQEGAMNVKQLADNEKIACEICPECLEAKKQADEEVLKGGIYWTCVKCHSFGCIKAGSNYAIEIRKNAGLDIPDETPNGPVYQKVAVELGEKTCPVCLERSDNKK